MKLKFPMLDYDPELQAQLERLDFTEEVAEHIGQGLIHLIQTATPSQDIKVEFEIGEDAKKQAIVVRYAMALVLKPQ
jgi:hypothetical protein